METSVNVISATSSPTIYEVIISSMLLQELESGRSQQGRLDGPTPESFGQVLVPANLSARQAQEAGLLTSGTYGPTGTISSASAALGKSLENKLRRRTDSVGSTLYRLTWKERATPSGRKISALRASAPRTSGSDSTSLARGWVTPSARDWKDSPGMATVRPDGRSRIDQLPRQAQLAGWPTPRAFDATTASERQRVTMPDRKRSSLGHDGLGATGLWMFPEGVTPRLAGWPTPAAQEPGGTPEQFLERKKRKPNGAITYLGLCSQLAGWPTPTSLSPAKNGNNPAGNSSGLVAIREIALGMGENPARLTASGEMLTGCSAETVSGGPLRAGHSRWLQAIPPVWEKLAPLEMPSTRKSLKRSSKPTSIVKPSSLIESLIVGILT